MLEMTKGSAHRCAILAVMVAVTRTTRGQWIEQGLKALAAGGPDKVRIEGLAQGLGVTKGGFYGCFADRTALLEAMLDTWEREAIDEVLEQAAGSGGDARTKLRRAGQLTFASERLLPIDLAIRDWARHDGAVARRLRRVDNRRMQYMRDLLSTFCSDPAEVEARAFLAFSLILGNHLLDTQHGTLTRNDVLARTRG